MGIIEQIKKFLNLVKIFLGPFGTKIDALIGPEIFLCKDLDLLNFLNIVHYRSIIGAGDQAL